MMDVETNKLLPTLIKKKDVSWLTYTLVCMFGVGSWVAVNGIWVELPNLVNSLPEGWKLPSYLAFICQLANIGPITYTLLRRKFIHKQIMFLRVSIYVLIVTGIVACVLLACFWKKTAFLLDKEVSLSLLILTFLLALVDCTSSVTFLPYMAILPGIYMSPLYIGETLSGLIPSIFALAQGVATSNANSTGNVTHNGKGNVIEQKLRFPQEGFFTLLALMMLLCLCAFVGINNLKSIHKIHVLESQPNGLTSDYVEPLLEEANIEKNKMENRKATFMHSHFDLMVLLCVLVWLNALQNGITSSISSYAYAPYGTLTYHLAATLGSISSALSCFSFLWFPHKSKKTVYIGSFLYTLFAIYIVIVACQDSNPWLKDKVGGKVLMVLVSIISSALVAFTKLAIASVMRDHGRKYLFRAGVSNQVGSFVGTVIAFPIVNFTNVFNG